MEAQENLKWWQKSWVMWLLLFIFTPAGLMLCYVNRERHSHYKAIMAVFAVLFVIGVAGGGGEKNAATTTSTTVTQNAKQEKKQAEKSYAEANIDQLLSEAEGNAAAAKKNYKGKSIKLVGGTLNNIDSEMNYIQVVGSDGLKFKWFQCYVGSDKAVKEAVMKLQNGQSVTVYGTITDVGDIVGYSMKIDRIE